MGDFHRFALKPALSRFASSPALRVSPLSGFHHTIAFAPLALRAPLASQNSAQTRPQAPYPDRRTASRSRQPCEGARGSIRGPVDGSGPSWQGLGPRVVRAGARRSEPRLGVAPAMLPLRGARGYRARPRPVPVRPADL
jgi:hypothetical protein